MATEPDEEMLDEFVRPMSRPGDMSRRQQIEFLENPFIRGLAQLSGVDMGHLDKVHRDADRAAHIAWLRAAAEFTRFGWTPSHRGPNRDGYIEAVEVWDAMHDPAAVDECLTRWWNDGMAHLKNAVGPLITLAGRHEPTRDILFARNRLVMRALKRHEEGDYEAAVLMLLPQIDGVVFDLTSNDFGFFHRAKEHYFEDDETVAGMELVLRRVWKVVNRDVRRTTESDEFLRHGILHGRVLGFGTQTNSTKAIALLGGVINWLGPIAHVETERRQSEDEARWAGSDAVDAEGKRMDRRGFVETRDSLRWLAIREANEHQEHGPYRGDLAAMFPGGAASIMKGGLPRIETIRLTVADDRQSWWAWAPSDSEFCFGIAGATDDVTNRYYAGVGAPGPPESDRRWTDDMDPPPDWSGD